MAFFWPKSLSHLVTKDILNSVVDGLEVTVRGREQSIQLVNFIPVVAHVVFVQLPARHPYR